MYKVLMVGCGGSGAKTLSFMMDQLRADLSHYGITDIPGCWQFISVDTPVQEEHLYGYGIPTVTQQGGSYVACGSTSDYQVVDSALTDDLKVRPDGLRRIATCLPETPESITVPIEDGAGQLRGLGRLLLLQHLSEVKAAATRAIGVMDSSDANLQATQVSQAVPGVGSAPEAGTTPLVFLVSSMAGGSGASMTLDVARILASIPGVDPKKTCLLLYTSDVFKSLDANKAGMPGNTLAFLGEAIAAQAQDGGLAGQEDNNLHSLFGTPTVPSRPFHRIFPIGSKSKDGVAPKPEVIYRSFGSGLARYISTPAIDRFVRYVLANQANSSFLWGVQGNQYAWSSMGYASLSMGRDRYTEYAAQRLARRAVDHVWEGHKDSAFVGGETQRLQALWEARGASELQSLGLSAAAGGQDLNGLAGWLLDQFGGHNLLRQEAKRVISEHVIAPSIVEGLPAGDWLNQMVAVSSEARLRIEAGLEAASTELVRRWSTDLVDRVEKVVSRAIGDLGLPYALKVIRSVGGAGGLIDNLAAQLTTLGMSPQAEELGTVPRDLATRVTQVGRGVLNAASLQSLKNLFDSGINDQAFQTLALSLATKAGVILNDYVTSVLAPMERALSEALLTVEMDRQADVQAEGVAEVGTRIYNAWPSEPIGAGDGNAVPARFANADNEITLMPTKDYLDRFDLDLVAAVASELGHDAGVVASTDQATRNIVTGVWPDAGKEKAPRNLVTRERQWVAKGLPNVNTVTIPRPAQFSVHTSAGDLLERARLFVGRKGESFQLFAQESIRGYLEDASASESVRAQRAEQVTAAMIQAIDMGKPYTTKIDPQTFKKVQPADPPGLLFSFSQIPFTASVNKAVLARIGQRTSEFNVNQVRGSYQDSCGNDPVTRVDVFGSAPSTVPVCYSAMLQDVRQAWNQVKGDKGARTEFWWMKRSRPLGAALPIGESERQALVRGWFLATAAGALDIPRGRNDDFAPVRIWDRTESEWVSFPAPMITPESQMRSPNDWLPAVLESILLAYLDAAEQGIDEAFRPWSVLRSYADNHDDGPTVGVVNERSDKALISVLITSGVAAPNLTPSIPEWDRLITGEERKEALLQWCDAVTKFIEEHYLPGANKLEGLNTGYWTNLSKREYIEDVSKTIDLAIDMKEQVDELRRIVQTTATGIDELIPGIVF